jgi:hypothetical protein
MIRPERTREARWLVLLRPQGGHPGTHHAVERSMCGAHRRPARRDTGGSATVETIEFLTTGELRAHYGWAVSYLGDRRCRVVTWRGLFDYGLPDEPLVTTRRWEVFDARSGDLLFETFSGTDAPRGTQ